MRKDLFAAAAVLGLVAVAPAMALPVAFEGSTYGSFSNTPASNDCRFSTGGGSNNGYAWGGDGSCPRFSDDSSADRDSTLVINTFSFDEDLSIGATDVTIGKLSWFNSSTDAGDTDDVISVTAELLLWVTAPTGEAVRKDNIRFRIVNTDNPEGDRIRVINFDNFGKALPDTLGTSGISITNYFARVDGMLSPLDGYRWTLFEDHAGHLEIVARVDVIPLPAAAWMLLAAAGGLIAVKRRSRALS